MSGHAFERKILQDAQYSNVFIHRIKTRMSGYQNDNEPGDFIIAHNGKTLLLEAKSTQDSAFPYMMIRPNQFVGLVEANVYDTVYGGVLVDMRKYRKVYYLPIDIIKEELRLGNKSMDLTNLEKYAIIENESRIDFRKLLDSLERRHNGT